MADTSVAKEHEEETVPVHQPTTRTRRRYQVVAAWDKRQTE